MSIQIYKFEDYNTYQVHNDVLDIQRSSSDIQELFPYQYRYSRKTNLRYVVPLPKDFLNTVLSLSENANAIPSIISTDAILKYSEFPLTFEDKLYFHSNCTIPRAKVTQKYTRTIKTHLADKCVVPVPRKSINITPMAIFLDSEKGNIYYFTLERKWISGQWRESLPTICSSYPLGTKVVDINKNLNNIRVTSNRYSNLDYWMPIWKLFLQSTLIYYGPALDLDYENSWIGDYVYKKIHNLITEDQVLATLGDTSNEFSKELYQSIQSMLNSSDGATVDIGIKTLAELNYEKYKNSIIHLLTHSNTLYRHRSVKQSTSVKHMLEFLGLYRFHNEVYKSSIHIDDFNLLKDILALCVEKEVLSFKNSFMSKYKFIDFELDYSYKITPKLTDENIKIEE